MQQWKIHHLGRCISYSRWGFYIAMAMFVYREGTKFLGYPSLFRPSQTLVFGSSLRAMISTSSDAMPQVRSGDLRLKHLNLSKSSVWIGYHGNPKPSFLRVISHILGV